MEPCLIHKAVFMRYEWEPVFPAYKNMRVSGQDIRWWRYLVKYEGHCPSSIRRDFGVKTSDTTIRTYTSDLLEGREAVTKYG